MKQRKLGKNPVNPLIASTATGWGTWRQWWAESRLPREDALAVAARTVQPGHGVPALRHGFRAAGTQRIPWTFHLKLIFLLAIALFS